MKQQHILQLFSASAGVSVEVQERLNARQRLLFSMLGKRLKPKAIRIPFFPVDFFSFSFLNSVFINIWEHCIKPYF